jgi:hypothetical protein
MGANVTLVTYLTFKRWDSLSLCTKGFRGCLSGFTFSPLDHARVVPFRGFSLDLLDIIWRISFMKFSRLFLFITWITLYRNPIYVFPDMKLRGLGPNSYIYVSVSDLFIPSFGLPIWLQKNRQTDPGNVYIAHRYIHVEIGRPNIIILFWK